MRIVYLLTKVERPTGGHSVIVDHVRLLRENGFDASVHFMQSSTESFYERFVPEQSRSDQSVFGEPDSTILVIPEADLAIWAETIFKQRRGLLQNIVVLNQNHFYSFNHGSDKYSWEIFRAAGHIATSKSIAKFLESTLGIPQVEIIPVPIDHDLFRPAIKVLQIAYMPRKLADEARFIERAFREMAPELRAVTWFPIDNMQRPDVAAVLNHSAVFLSLATKEGFGMPALEALASGCIVVGFTGFGGDEYASDRNGIWIEEGNLAAVSRNLVRVVRDLLTKECYLDRLARIGISTASRYDLNLTTRALLDVWGKRANKLSQSNILLKLYS